MSDTVHGPKSEEARERAENLVLPMAVALDAMGGDHAPAAIVEGALQALPLMKGKLFLVGDTARLMPLLPTPLPANLELVHASQEVGMDEKPTEAYRKKKDSSIMVGVNLVNDARAGAFVSAGNTGACSSTSLLIWRQIHGIHRPAIASPIPNRHRGFLLLDAGASPDVDPEHILEFALMGRAYAKSVLGRENPTVHLLNIGEEDGKGNAFAKQAFALLKNHPWFKGNIEGKDVFHQDVDVVVCDAFVGNVFLKVSEGIAELIVDMVRAGVPRTGPQKWLYWPVKKVFAPVRKKLDYAEYGGSPLLGLNGITIICHGRSNAKAIKNAILVAERAIEGAVVDRIRESLLNPSG